MLGWLLWAIGTHPALREQWVFKGGTFQRKCTYKDIPLPTLEAVSASEKAADLRADWAAMLAHQLPTLPPVDELLGELPALFAWLAGQPTAHLRPIPAAGEKLDRTWVVPPTLRRWPAGAPLEQIRFAGANHLLVELHYQQSSRLIEPYALRRSQTGNLLVYAIKAETGEVRAYRVDRIEGIRVINRPFRPRYAIELSAALPVSTGRRRARLRPPGAARGPR